MKNLILTILCLSLAPLASLASGKQDSLEAVEKVLKSAGPYLDEDSLIVRIQKTWAINDEGGDWLVVTYDEKLGSTFITLNRRFEVIDKHTCPPSTHPKDPRCKD